MKRNKEVIAHLARKTKFRIKDIEILFDEYERYICDTLSKSEGVEIMKLGNITRRFRSERLGVNPQTGEHIMIQSTFTPKFKSYKKLIDAVKDMDNIKVRVKKDIVIEGDEYIKGQEVLVTFDRYKKNQNYFKLLKS